MKPAPRAMRGQLDLFSAEDEALRRLHEQLAGLAAAHEALWERHEALEKALAAANQQCHHWRGQAAYWRDQALTPASLAARCERAALEPSLKRLLLLCHPDRWSAGQPATALAHELAVAINATRAALEVQG